MEVVQTILGAPAPTLLVIGGLILLILGLISVEKPIVIKVTPTNRKIAMGLGITLIVAGIYFLSLQIPSQISEITVTATAETPSPIATSSQNALPEINTPTQPLVSGFENNCINSIFWKSYKGGTNESGCWQLQKVGISAQDDGLFIFVDKNQNTDWRGIYTEIPQNADINFNIKIDKLLTPNNDAARIAFGIINPDDPMTGKFLYYREIASTSYVQIEFGESIDNAIIVGNYTPYGQKQKVTILIRDIALQVLIDNAPIGEPMNISFPKHAFGIYYRPVIDSSVSSFITDLVIEKK